jgi:hypothetical protein
MMATLPLDQAMEAAKTVQLGAQYIKRIKMLIEEGLKIVEINREVDL